VCLPGPAVDVKFRWGGGVQWRLWKDRGRESRLNTLLSCLSALDCSTSIMLIGKGNKGCYGKKEYSTYGRVI